MPKAAGITRIIRAPKRRGGAKVGAILVMPMTDSGCSPLKVDAFLTF
jgi:hypothetical protein